MRTLVLAFLPLVALSQVMEQPKGIHQIEWERRQTEGPAVKGDGSQPRYGPLGPRPQVLVERTVYGYSPYWTSDQFLHFNKITHYACFSVGVNGDGSLNNSHNFPQTWAWGISHAHRTGVKVILCATCFNGATIHSIVTTGATNAINNLLNMVRSAGIEGVNIDFEGVPGADRANLTIFMQQLAAAFRPYGLEVTIATPPVDWSNAFDYRAIADTTDGVFIMGYNYHYSGSSEAGPCAPLAGWGTYNIRWTTTDYLVKTNYNRGKIILGLPYYGYEWPTETGSAHSRTTGSGSATIYADAVPRARARGERWDGESQTPWYAWQSGAQWYQGWFDNEQSLLVKYDDLNRNRLVGSGMWALAYDGARQELWAAIMSAFNRPGSFFTNGDCETWIIDTVGVPSNPNPVPAGWCLGEYAQWERANDYVHGGQYAIRHNPDSLGRAWPVNSVVFQDVMVLAGARYEFSGWARKNDGCGNRMKLNIQWFDADHAILAEVSSPELVSDSNQYRFLTTGPALAPGGTRFARLRLCIQGYGYWDRWDDLSFIQVAPVEEFSSEMQNPRSGILTLGPNPFQDKLAIWFSVSETGKNTLRVFDGSGRCVKTFYRDEQLKPGIQRVTWCGTDDTGRRLPAGTYFVVSTSGSLRDSSKGSRRDKNPSARVVRKVAFLR